MRTPEGQIHGQLSELGETASSPVIQRLGGLSAGFCLEYIHGDILSEYRLALGNAPLSPESTLDVLYDPLRGGKWGARDTSSAFGQMLNPASRLYRTAADLYKTPPGVPLRPHIDTIMDVLDSTSELAWQHRVAPAFDESSVVNEVDGRIPDLSLQDFNRLWTQANLPDLPYKWLKRRSAAESQRERAQFLVGLNSAQQNAFFTAVREELFASFSATPTDAQPDTTLDRSGSIYIARSDLPDDCTPANVHEVVVGPEIQKPATKQQSSDTPPNLLYPIDFRTTRTLYTARPTLSWMTFEGKREFLLPRSVVEQDPLEETAVATEYLLGIYVAASLCDRAIIDQHTQKFPRRYRAVATLPHMALAHADDILASTPLVIKLENLAGS